LGGGLVGLDGDVDTDADEGFGGLDGARAVEGTADLEAEREEENIEATMKLGVPLSADVDAPHPDDNSPLSPASAEQRTSAAGRRARLSSAGSNSEGDRAAAIPFLLMSRRGSWELARQAGKRFRPQLRS
jgi:hypothetical protein